MNGEEVEQIGADFVLRGVVIPQGESHIVWEFKQPHRDLLLGVASWSSVVILLWLIAALILWIKDTIISKKSL